MHATCVATFFKLSDIPPTFLFPEKEKEIGKIHVAFFKLHVSDDDDGVGKEKEIKKGGKLLLHFISASVVTKVEFPEIERKKNTQQIEDKRSAFPSCPPKK